MIRLLILCRYFPPENKIGSVRPSKIAKFLMKTGKYKITVVTAFPYGIDCPKYEITEDGIEVFRVDMGKMAKLLHYKESGKGAAVSSEISKSSNKINVKHFIISKLFRLRLSMEKKAMLNNAKRLLRSSKKKFDVVFSTYNTEFGHLIASWYKRKHNNVPWIADFRDSVWLTDSNPEQIEKAKAFVRNTAQHCDIITAVCQGILETHSAEFSEKEKVVVYNGFDSEDIPEISPLNDGIMRITYTGELYSGRRDLTPLFKALYRLADEERVDLSKIQIVYAGNSGGVFEQQIGNFSKINHINKGFVPRKEALCMQGTSDILLLSSWCHKGDKYTITGKFFEYLGMKKPILSVISGDESGCVLRSMINENRLGFCYEEANKSTDFDMMCNYLEQQYKFFENSGVAYYTPDEEFIDSFQYRSIAKQIDNIVCKLLSA